MTQEPVGSLAEEAIKLFAALTASQQPESAAQSAQAQDCAQYETTVHETTGQRCPHPWCPVCQLTEYVQDNPELIEHVTESAASLFASVRYLLDHISAKEEE